MANSYRSADAICPFFMSEKRKSITCEDCFRLFNSLEKKDAWMDKYCSNSWEDCPHAKKLNDAYERVEQGDKMALEQNMIDSLRKELKGAFSKISRLENKLRKAEAKNKDLEIQKKLIYEKCRKAVQELSEYKNKEAERYYSLAKLYEDRIAYLIDTFCGGKLEENTVKAWAEGKEYALTFDEKSKDPIWIVKVRDEEEESNEQILES